MTALNDDPLARDLRSLADDAPEVDGIDIVASVRAAVGPEAPRARVVPFTARASSWMAFAGAAACAAVVVLAIVRRDEPSTAPNDGFRAKGPAAVADDDLVGVSVYRRDGGAMVPVDGAVASGDALGMSITNLAHFKHALVFAVDARGGVYWYAPPWLDASADPASVDVGDGRSELLHAVAHALPLGRVTVFALFSDVPAHVRAVEATHPTLDGVDVKSLALGRTALASVALEVKP